MAGQSLSVQQDATAVAGQNLANVNNPAYADEQLQIQAATPLQTPIGEEGDGVESVSITSMRDALLDAQVAAEGSVTGSLNSQQSALQQAEAYLDEQISGSTTAGTSSPNGLAADLSGLFNSLQTLSTDPSNISDRQAVVQSAQQLTEQFNQVSSGLATVTSDLNTSIQSDVAASNQDLIQIASLNQQIIEAQNSGGTANDLVDLREQTIEDLAGKMNITTSAQSDGAVNVSIGGCNMVEGGTAVDALGAAVNDQGNRIVADRNNGAPLTITSGSVEGSITARDGAVASLQSSINTLATQLITQVNAVYSTGYDLNGNTRQPFFTGSNASDISVNSTLVSDPSTFQASGTEGDTGDNTVVLALANLDQTPSAGLNNQTFSQNYAATVGTFGSSLQSVNEQLGNSTAVSQMLANQRDSASGVDTDTEMTNLMQFQKAYEASAELVTTINQMLETVVYMKTE